MHDSPESSSEEASMGSDTLNPSRDPDTSNSGTTAASAALDLDLPDDFPYEGLGALPQHSQAFIPQFPSAAPTPLYHRMPLDRHGIPQKLHSPPGHPNKPVPMLPIAPPDDLLTHFAVMNNHLSMSTAEIKDFIQDSSIELVSQLRHKYSDNIKNLNDSFGHVYDQFDYLNHQFEELASSVKQNQQESAKTAENGEEIRATVDVLRDQLSDNFKDIQQNLQSLVQAVQGVLSTTDKVLFQNTEMAKKINGMMTKIQGLENTQTGIVHFLSARHASFPYGYNSSHQFASADNLSNISRANSNGAQRTPNTSRRHPAKDSAPRSQHTYVQHPALRQSPAKTNSTGSQQAPQQPSQTHDQRQTRASHPLWQEKLMHQLQNNGPDPFMG